MAENTKIEWADSTFNPWEGCTKVGPGCDNCYAEVRNARFAGGAAINWGPGAPRRRTSTANWRKPMAWNKANFFECPGCGWRGIDDEPSSRLQVCMKCATRLEPARQRVFCASLADVFDNEVDPLWRADLFRLIASTPNLDWLLLTKRIGNAGDMIEAGRHHLWQEGLLGGDWPLPNIWIGATITSQVEADRDIPKLLAVPAAKRFLSIEPMLGPISLTKAGAIRSMCATCAAGQSRGCILSQPGPFVDWVICGGESGPNARPMHPDWVRRLRDQCASAGVPFMFKQWGEWAPNCLCETAYAHKEIPRPAGKLGVMFRCGKSAAGRLLDGVEHNGEPL